MNEARYATDDENGNGKKAMEAWQSLVHVCWRWRSVVFGSPRLLDLQLVCSSKTPARDTVEVWPALPLVIQDYHCVASRMDIIISLLKRSDLVHRTIGINLWNVPSMQLENISEAMQVPFPELTHLELRRLSRFRSSQTPFPFSDSFLGGSAPQLRTLYLDRIPYPGLPKLLLSTTHLTYLHLYFYHSGHISPEVMIACLSTLTSIEELYLGFESPRPLPDRETRCRLPPTRTVLPVLRRFTFRGVGEYLEYLVARVDAPRLNSLEIAFFSDIVFDTPQLAQFISHIPTLEAFNTARFVLGVGAAYITFSSAHEDLDANFDVRIFCRELDRQLLLLEQICTSSLPSLSTLEDLYMSGRWRPQDSRDNTGYTQLQELLHSFPAVKNLYLSKELAPCVVPALQELVGGRATAVFPNLQNIFLEELEELGPVQDGIGVLVATRQVTSHPIAVSRWERDADSDY